MLKTIISLVPHNIFMMHTLNTNVGTKDYKKNYAFYEVY